jgi:hypothetical protein
VRALRSSGAPALSELGVLVRPHPDRPGSWESVDLGAFPNAVLWPPRRPNAVLPEARSDYFDSLFHSAAVVGVNTSAMIEAAIVGRPVLTIRSPAFREAQGGTVHFRYLLPESGGFLVLAPDVEHHVRQLAMCIADPLFGEENRRRFVESFIRPLGAGVLANDVLVERIVALGVSKPSVTSAGARGVVLRALVRAAGPVLGARDGKDEQRRLRAHLADRSERLRASRVPAAGSIARLHDGYARYRLAFVVRRWKRRGRLLEELREEKRRLLAVGSQDTD